MTIPIMIPVVLAGAFLSASCSRGPRAADPVDASPARAAAALWAADSAFAAASAGTDVVTGLSAMFAADVTMPAPGGTFAEGAPAVTELLRSNPDNARSVARWTPIRVGVSADGLHGFSFGYGTSARPDSSQTRWKYLSYWVKGAEGWRVAVYKRGPQAEGDVSLGRMPPSVPSAAAPGADAAAIEGFRTSLDQAERAFSDEAQQVGLGAAFVKWGRIDAVNMGGPGTAAFVVGSEAIGAAVGRGGPATSSPVSWAPDRVIVAASGDLGVTIGFIRPNQTPAAGAATGFPFFTIWYRPSLTDPWRYIAE